MDNSVRQYLKSLGVRDNGIESLEKRYAHPTRDSIDKKIASLRERGFDDPVKIISKHSSTMTLPFDNIDKKVAGLQDRGFNDPVKMIGVFPSILGLSFDNIDKKVAGLQDRGFNDPVKMIRLYPLILGISLDKIDKKIAGLRERGFDNPVKMIKTLPAILGLSFDNIDRKLRYARKFNGFGVDGIAVIEALPMILSYNIKRIFLYARAAFSLRDGDRKIFTALVTQEPRAVVAGLLIADSPTKKELYRGIRARKGRNSENTALIMEHKDHKVVRAYLRYKAA